MIIIICSISAEKISCYYWLDIPHRIKSKLAKIMFKLYTM